MPPRALREEDNVLRSNMRLSVITDLVSPVFCVISQLDSHYPNWNVVIPTQQKGFWPSRTWQSAADYNPKFFIQETASRAGGVKNSWCDSDTKIWLGNIEGIFVVTARSNSGLLSCFIFNYNPLNFSTIFTNHPPTTLFSKSMEWLFCVCYIESNIKYFIWGVSKTVLHMLRVLYQIGMTLAFITRTMHDFSRVIIIAIWGKVPFDNSA